MKIALFFFTFSICFSQNFKFQIRDSITQKPIQFVSVNLLNGYGFYSNEYGEVNLYHLEVEKIQLSHLSYETKEIKIKNINDVVFLNLKTNAIKEVIITQGKNKVYISNKKSKLKDSLFCDFGTYGYELAIPIKIEIKDKKCYLDEINIPIRIDDIWMKINNIGEKPLSLIRINFSENFNNIPSDSLLTNSEYYFIDKKTLQRKSIQYKLKKRLLVPSDGLFCIITFLGKADVNGNLVIEMPTYKSKFLGKDFVYSRFQPLQIPILDADSEMLTFCRNSFSKNSMFNKVIPRTSTPQNLTKEETQFYLTDKVNKTPNYKVQIDCKYYYYE
jgi:hypothetical protein